MRSSHSLLAQMIKLTKLNTRFPGKYEITACWRTTTHSQCDTPSAGMIKQESSGTVLLPFIQKRWIFWIIPSSAWHGRLEEHHTIGFSASLDLGILGEVRDGISLDLDGFPHLHALAFVKIKNGKVERVNREWLTIVSGCEREIKGCRA